MAKTKVQLVEELQAVTAERDMLKQVLALEKQAAEIEAYKPVEVTSFVVADENPGCSEELKAVMRAMMQNINNKMADGVTRMFYPPTMTYQSTDVP